MAQELFDEKAERYEVLIDWPRRLANEAPFYRGLFESCGVKNILDTACGSGHHAEMFHSWGLRVEGADISPGMIELCRSRLGESESLRWVVRSFDTPSELPASFDAVICVGNSLSLADNPATIERAIGAMLASTRPGGVCVIQVLNIWSLPDGPTVWQKSKRVELGGREHILLKGVRRSGSRAWVEFVDLTLSKPGLALWSESTAFAGLEAPQLADTARTAGASSVDLYGSYGRAPYDQEKSTDIILVCTK